MKEEILDIKGLYGRPERIQIGIQPDGYVLYIERRDGEGVAVPVSQETFDSLQKSFILKEVEETEE